MIFPTGSELHALSRPHFDVYTLSVSNDALVNTAMHLGLPGLETVIRNQEVLHCQPSAIAETRGILRDLEDSPSLHLFAANQIRITLAQLLASSAGVKAASARTRTRRQRIVLDAEKLIALQPEDPLTVLRLCGYTGVSKRTLEYAFAEQIGVTPKSFINAIRLNAVRKQLRLGTVQKVVDAANAWGFWHMGQFAADYRKLFGENPSVTLGCHKGLREA